MLEGTLGFAQVTKVEASTGCAALMPRGVPDYLLKSGAGQLRYLLAMTPRIRSSIADIHAMAERTPPALQAVFRKHDSELL